MRARLVLVVLLSLVLIAAGPWSARAESPTAAVAASAAFPFVATAVNFSPLIAPDLAGITPWISNPLLLGTHVPMYWLDAGRAGWYTAGGLALPAAGVSLMLSAPEGSVAGEWVPSLIGSTRSCFRSCIFRTTCSVDSSRRRSHSTSPGAVP